MEKNLSLQEKYAPHNACFGCGPANPHGLKIRSFPKETEVVASFIPEQYQEAFFHYAWSIDNATGLRLDWGLVNTKQLLMPFDITNPKNIELQNALKNYTIAGKKALRSALLNGLTPHNVLIIAHKAIYIFL